jgi:bifunctional DNase/RNase
MHQQVKVDSVRVGAASAVVYLRVLSTGRLLPVHVGSAESAALLREVAAERQAHARPMTHDLAKALVAAAGYRVTKVGWLVFWLWFC